MPISNNNSHNQAERATLISATSNVVLSTLQIIVGYLAHSQALIADGIHTLSDLVADFIVLLANRKSRQGADEDHQYGHARYENAGSLALGAILVVVGIGMLYKAGLRIAQPSNIAAVHGAALWMALTALVCKESLFRYMNYVAKKLNSSLLAANAWHARSDAASSLIVAAGVIGNMAGFRVFDPIAAALVGLFVLRIGSKIAWSSLSDLMDHALPVDEIEAIKQTLTSTPGVLDAHDLRSRRMGDLAFIDVHIEVSPRISVTEGHYIAVEAQRKVIAKHKVSEVLVHIDPPDEEQSKIPGMLLRHDIDAILAPIAAEYAQFDYSFDLHYLDGLIEIVLVLPHKLCEQDQISLLAKIQEKIDSTVRIQLLQKL